MSSQVTGPGIVPQMRPMLPTMNGDYSHWLSTNVRKQKQSGYFVVNATITLGDFTSQQMRILGDLATAFADGMVRITAEQNLVFRWVPTDAVPELYRQLAAAGLGLADAGTIADVTSCPGAESCKLAVTQSRGLGRFLGDHLREHPELIAKAPDLQIKISGCPNGCGRHHIAGLGFQGSVRKVGGRAIPQYFVMVGGGPDGDAVRFGRLAAKVPARRLTAALERLLDLYLSDKHDGETATAFFMRVDVARVKDVLADLEQMTSSSAVADDYVDLAETGAVQSRNSRRRVLGVSRASLYRALWASSALPGQLGNAFLYLAAGLLRADDLDAAARDEWIDFSISNEDVDAGLSRDERQFFESHLRSGDRVLLVGCGAGRDLLALGRLGIPRRWPRPLAAGDRDRARASRAARCCRRAAHGDHRVRRARPTLRRGDFFQRLLFARSRRAAPCRGARDASPIISRPEGECWSAITGSHASRHSACGCFARARARHEPTGRRSPATCSGVTGLAAPCAIVITSRARR